MIPRATLATLLGSFAAHGGALATLIFVVSSESPPAALFIDLETIAERQAPVDQKPAPVAPSPSGGSRKHAASIPSAAAPAPAPQPERAREPAPVTPPAEEPRQPVPAVTIAPPRESVPDVVAKSEVTPAPEARSSSSDASGERNAAAIEPGGGRTTPGGPPGVGTGGGGTGVAPSGPAGGAPGAEYGGYLATVRRRILEALRYPPPARSRGLTGTVQLEISIKPDGAISTVSVTSSSSHPLLDEAALEAVRSLAPQPFPKGLAPRPLRVRLPVVFDLQ